MQHLLYQDSYMSQLLAASQLYLHNTEETNHFMVNKHYCLLSGTIRPFQARKLNRQPCKLTARHGRNFSFRQGRQPTRGFAENRIGSHTSLRTHLQGACSSTRSRRALHTPQSRRSRPAASRAARLRPHRLSSPASKVSDAWPTPKISIFVRNTA